MRDGGGRIRGTGLVSGSTAGVLGGTVLCGGAVLGRAGTSQWPRPGQGRDPAAASPWPLFTR